MSFGKTIYYTIMHCYFLLTFHAMQLSRRSLYGVQGACSSILSNVPMVIWHMGDGFLKKNTRQQSNSICNTWEFTDLSSSVYIVFRFKYIDIWAIQSNLYVIFIFLVHCYKTFFLCLRFLTLFNLFDTYAYRLDYCHSHYRIMFSVLKYLDISCCWM